MSKSLRVLVIINPGASRAEAALPAVSSWFSENSDATIVVAKSKKDRAKGVRPASRPPIPDYEPIWTADAPGIIPDAETEAFLRLERKRSLEF